MEKVRPWCGQPLNRGRLKNRTEDNLASFLVYFILYWNTCSLRFAGAYFALYSVFSVQCFCTGKSVSELATFCVVRDVKVTLTYSVKLDFI